MSLYRKHGDDLFQQGRFEEALQAYREVLERNPDLPVDTQLSLIAKILQCLVKESRQDETLKEIERWEKRFAAGSIHRAKLLVLKAEMYKQVGDYGGVLEAGEVAYELLRRTAENSDLARVERALGDGYLFIGDLRNARRFYEGLLSLSLRFDDETGIFAATYGLSCIHVVTSRWNQALEYLEQGLALAEKKQKSHWVAACSASMGTIYAVVGKWNLAEKHLKKAVEINEGLGNLYNAIDTYVSLAYLYRLERKWDDAYPLLERSLALSKKFGKRIKTVDCLEGLGEIFCEKGDYGKAEEYFKRALDLANEVAPQGDRSGTMLTHLADLALLLDAPDQALQHASAAFRIARALGDRLEEARCCRALGLTYHKLNAPERAKELLTHAIEILDEIEVRYEAAKTYLELGRLLRSQGNTEGAMRSLVRAEELFERLPSPYWLGMTELEIAGTKAQAKEFDSALVSLESSQKAFLESGERGLLRKVQRFRKKIEETMVASSVALVSQGSLDELLTSLLGELQGLRVFVGIVKEERLEIWGRYNLEEGEINKLFGYLKRMGRLEFPLMSSGVLGERGESPLMDAGISSFIVVPFQSAVEQGIFYMDRPSGTLGHRDLLSSIILSQNLALRIAEERQEQLRRENLRLRQQLRSREFPEIITRDERMLNILAIVEKVKDDPAPVLIEGETGTGKELVARALHYKGNRAPKPFVPVDCGALPSTLAESVLFGYRKGAFTDAKEDRAGLFEEADGGTLFLDEISNLDLGIQVKLLRVLQDGRIRRIGETGERKVNVRVIAASNRNLEREMREGRFRSDLFYRLNRIRIQLPPLRERKRDIPLLVDHFVRKFSKEKKKKVKEITPEAMKAITQYDWRGNVRELESEIERAIILMESGRVTPDLFSFQIGQKAVRKKRKYDLERLIQVLEECNWIKRKAARTLGIPESTLRRRLKVHGIKSRSDAKRIVSK